MSEIAATNRATTSRNQVVDAIRGVAILLVVLGHAIQNHVADPDRSLGFRLIYSFHMPLFMILSGWTTKPETPGRIAKTLKRLLPPFFAWYAIQYFVERHYRDTSFPRYFLELLKQPDVGLWFLWVLAICISLLVLLHRLEARIGLWAYLLGILFVSILPLHVLGVPLVRLYLPYVVIGYLAHRYRLHQHRWRDVVIVLSVPIFLVGVKLWHLNYASMPPLYGPSLGHNPLPLRAPEYILVKVATALSGSVLTAWLTAFVYARTHLRVLPWMGRKTMQIYVSHQYFVHLLPVPGILAITAVFLLALLASLMISAVVERVAGLRTVLYGE